MIIVKFCSGVGNQLYQYAVYKLLEKLYPKQDVLADISVFEDIQRLNQGNGFDYGFALEKIFDIQVKKATREQIDSVNYEIYFNEKWRKILPEKFCQKYAGASRLAGLRAKVFPKYKEMREHYITAYPFDAFIGDLYFLENDKNYYISGLWQNYNYFSEIEELLRKELVFSKEMSSYGVKLRNTIENCNSVCVHVRRGDFTSDRYRETHDICGKKYYMKAIRLIKEKIENPHFYVFSDDIDYCKEIFSETENIYFLSGGGKLRLDEEMQLMSSCKSAIIANSTFAFWNVWLSDHEKKIVLFPKFIVKEKYCWHEFEVPKHWIAVNNLIG